VVRVNFACSFAVNIKNFWVSETLLTVNEMITLGEGRESDVI
jgi:hypothetical protein